MVQVLRSAPPDWSKGNCAGKINPAETPDGVHPAELFFEEAWDGPDELAEAREAALLYCNGDGRKRPVCPIRKECLLFALRNNERDGVWGGMLPDDRTHMRRFLIRKKDVDPERLWQWHPPIPRDQAGNPLGITVSESQKES